MATKQKGNIAPPHSVDQTQTVEKRRGQKGPH